METANGKNAAHTVAVFESDLWSKKAEFEEIAPQFGFTKLLAAPLSWGRRPLQPVGALACGRAHPRRSHRTVIRKPPETID
ncbi:hypothetical protein GCM10027570_34810 [Streptomonospora sediminis]